jgi:hypothetical protein
MPATTSHRSRTTQLYLTAAADQRAARDLAYDVLTDQGLSGATASRYASEVAATWTAHRPRTACPEGYGTALAAAWGALVATLTCTSCGDRGVTGNQLQLRWVGAQGWRCPRCRVPHVTRHQLAAITATPLTEVPQACTDCGQPHDLDAIACADPDLLDSLAAAALPCAGCGTRERVTPCEALGQLCPRCQAECPCCAA